MLTKEKMIKNAPKILAIVMLVIIAVLLIITSINADGNKVIVNAEVDEKTDNDTKLQDSELSIDNVSLATDINTISTLSHTLPKLARQDDKYSFVQSLDINDNMELHNVISIRNYIYIIVSLCSSSGDIITDSNCVTIIKMSENGDFVDCLILSEHHSTKYLTSYITDSGIVIIYSDDDKTYLNFISEGLEVSSKLDLPKFDNATIYPISTGFMLFVNSEETVNAFYIQNYSIIANTTFTANKIIKIFELKNTLTIFTNTIDGYTVYSFDKNLNEVSEIKINDRFIIDVFPVVDGNIQKYVVIEKTTEGIFLAKHSSNFSSSNSQRVGIGIADEVSVFNNNENIFIFIKNSTSRIYLIDNNLNFNIVSSVNSADITSIYDCLSYENGFLMLTNTQNKLSVMDIRNDGTVCKNNVQLDVSNAKILKKDDTMIVFYTYIDKDIQRLKIIADKLA